MNLQLLLSEADIKLLEDKYIERFSGANAAQFSSGERLLIRVGSRIEGFSRHPKGTLIEMGAFSYISGEGRALLDLRVGRYCSIAHGVRILQGHHPIDAVSTSPFTYGGYYKAGNIPDEFVYAGPRKAFSQSYGLAVVENDVWIGAHATIMAGITIGNGAVVAGGANVVSDVPPYSIVGGNPAKIIRYRFDDDLCSELARTEWWNIHPSILSGLNMYDPVKFCAQVKGLREREELVPFAPPMPCLKKAP